MISTKGGMLLQEVVILQNNMRSIRNALKISLRTLSERSGISITHLGRIERGESDPTLTTMRKIAWGLRKEVWEVFDCQNCK